MERGLGSGAADVVSAVDTLAPAQPFAPARPSVLEAASLDGLDDATLMLHYREGEARAFDILYARHKGALHRYLQRMCRGSEAVNDLYQEVWGKVVASRHRYEVRAQFSTFLFRIAHNCLVDHFRRAGRQQRVQSTDPAELADELPDAPYERPDRKLAEAQARAALREALERLPAEQRDAFVLYEETGLSLEEIGSITGVGMETAKSRLRYAVSKLRAALREYQDAQTEAGS